MKIRDIYLEIGDQATDLMTAAITGPAALEELFSNEDLVVVIGRQIYADAREFFEKLGFKEDFGWQAALVFGGTNRIRWSPWGWVMLTEYCSPNFRLRFVGQMFNNTNKKGD